MKDVLDLFGELPDFPGKTKPKNRPEGIPKKAMDDPFVGVSKKTAVVNGKTIDLYTIGALASIVGRKSQTVRKWERKGWIPSPTYRTSKASGAELLNTDRKGYRLYSREQVETVLEALELNGLLGTRNGSWQEANNWVSFISHIQANWPK
jgi:hypothetical protein